MGWPMAVVFCVFFICLAYAHTKDVKSSSERKDDERP